MINTILVMGPEGNRETMDLTDENSEEYAGVLDLILEGLDSAEGGDTYRNRHWSGNPGGHNKKKFSKLKKKCAKCH